MYCLHFGLQRLPFNNTPDPTFYYSTPDHEEALATLQYATQQRKGFVLVSGEIGAGKTLIGRVFLRQMDANATIAAINQTNLTGRQLLAAICSEFNLPVSPDATNLDLTQRLQEFLLEQFARDRVVVVLLDEAQNLPDESFEELRMLGNLEADDAKLLQVCILGQPELRERFRKPNMKQLDQRLFRRFHLSPLSAQQTAEYIVHRLTVAGAADQQLFTPGAVNRIYAASGGIPRLINQICDNALLTAYGQDRRQVDERIIDLVLERDTSLRPGAAPDAARAGLVPTEDALIDPPETQRLAELAMQQTRELNARIEALVGSGAPRPEELNKISERQSELHKIVGGATARWLAAKEKVEAYRREIQEAITTLSDRCARTQEQLRELSRSSAPAEDLDEIRQMHLRESERLLKKIQEQREDTERRLQEAEKRWNEMHSRIQAVASEPRSSEALKELTAQHEEQLRDLLSGIERERKESVTNITAVQQKCDQLRKHVDALQANIERFARERAAEVEQLTSRLVQQEEQVRGLKQQISGSFESMNRSIERLGADAARAGDLDRIRTEHAGALAELMRRYNEQSLALRKLKQVIVRETRTQNSAQQQVALELTGRIDRQAAELEKLRRTMVDAEVALQRRMAELVSRNELDDVRRNQEAQAGAILDRIAANRGLIEKHADQVSREISSVLGQLDQQKQNLAEQVKAVASRCAQVEERVEVLRARTDTGEIQELRRQHLEDTEAVRRTLSAQQRDFEKLATRVNRRCEQLLERFRGLPHPLPTAAEIEAIRLECAQQVQLLHKELAEGKQDAEAAVRQLDERCDGLLSAIETVASGKVDHEQLAEFRRIQNDKVESLQRELEARQAEQDDTVRQIGARQAEQDDTVRQIGARQAEQDGVVRDLSAKCEATQASAEALRQQHVQHVRSLREQQVQEMEALRQQQAAEVRELRQDQERTVAGMLERIDSQKSVYLGNMAELNHRWDALNQSLQKLAANSTPPSAVQHVEESLKQRVESLGADLAGKIQATDAAAADQVARLRQEHDASLKELMARLDSARAEHQEEVADLSRRWQELTVSIQNLAANSTSPATLREVEQALQQNLAELQERITKTRLEQEQNLRTLVEKVLETSERLSELEAANTGPIQIELGPEVRHELSEVVRSAQQERQQLNEALERAGAIAAHLHNSSSHVQEVIQHWMETAADVREQSDRVRASAKTASEVLAAMQRCHATIEAKLNSQTWRTELQHAEQLTTRLEQAASAGRTICRQLQAALHDFDACRGDLEGWTKRQDQARHVAERLAGLLAEANSTSVRFERTLDSRKRMLQAIAKNTSSLAEVIQSARLSDEQQHPTQAAPSAERVRVPPPERTGGRLVTPIQWRNLKTHVAS